jgi:hypothetical protein
LILQGFKLFFRPPFQRPLIVPSTPFHCSLGEDLGEELIEGTFAAELLSYIRNKRDMEEKFKSFIQAGFRSFVGAVCAGAVMLIASSAQALIYTIDRSITDGVADATANLTGTLDIPVGNYTIQNSSASPFTSVNLTLTVLGTPYIVDNVLTGIIRGTGQFFVDAGSTTLTFSTANSNVSNPADLEFSDNIGFRTVRL